MIRCDQILYKCYEWCFKRRKIESGKVAWKSAALKSVLEISERKFSSRASRSLTNTWRCEGQPAGIIPGMRGGECVCSFVTICSRLLVINDLCIRCFCCSRKIIYCRKFGEQRRGKLITRAQLDGKLLSPPEIFKTRTGCDTLVYFIFRFLFSCTSA